MSDAGYLCTKYPDKTKKRKLALCYGDNRQEYMLAKTEFVEKYTRLAEEGGKV